MQPPTNPEMRRGSQRSALPVRALVRWLRQGPRFGLAFAGLLTAAGLLAIYIDSSPRTIAIAALLCAASFWSALRLRRTPRQGAAGGYQQSAELRLGELRADFRRALAWACLFPVGTFLASLLKFSALSTAGMEVVVPRIIEHARRGDPTLGALLFTLGVMLFFAHRAFRIWLEIRRVKALAPAGPFPAA